MWLSMFKQKMWACYVTPGPCYMCFVDLIILSARMPAYLTICVCVSVALRLSHHGSPLIRPDRCYYIEMRAVMYASVMWTCPLLLDGT